jgi:hypothetical protein
MFSKFHLVCTNIVFRSNQSTKSLNRHGVLTASVMVALVEQSF